MSLYDQLMVLLGLKRKRPAAPVFVARSVAVTVFGTNKKPLTAHVRLDCRPPFEGVTNEDGYICFTNVPGNMGASHLDVDAEGYIPFSTHVDLTPNVNQTLRVGDPFVFNTGDIALAPLVSIVPPKSVRAKPMGIVRAERHHFVDDLGVFFPLGHSLFWALRGWHAGGDERERVKKNIDWIGTVAKADYIRILGQVGWAGLEIRPEWAEYEADLAGLIDYAYEQGVRTQVTLVGGGTYDIDQLVNKVVNVVNARKEKIYILEVANEWSNGNWNWDIERLKATGRKLRERTGLLVALSSPMTDPPAEENKDWVRSGAANVMLAHFDRDDSKGDWKWRHVRKPWEDRNMGVPCDSNEPGGPRSSVAQYEEAIHLAMARAVGILCKWDGYCLHNGSGIFGVSQDKYGGRFPNVWETPGIDNTATCVHDITSYLPANASDGTPTRAGLGPHPLTADAFMSEGGRGAARDYCLVQGDGFWQTLFGIRDYVNLKSNDNYDLSFINPLTGDVMRTAHVSAGESIRVEPMDGAKDSRGLGAFIIIGTRT